MTAGCHAMNKPFNIWWPLVVRTLPHSGLSKNRSGHVQKLLFIVHIRNGHISLFGAVVETL